MGHTEDDTSEIPVTFSAKGGGQSRSSWPTHMLFDPTNTPYHRLLAKGIMPVGREDAKALRNPDATIRTIAIVDKTLG